MQYKRNRVLRGYKLYFNVRCRGCDKAHSRFYWQLDCGNIILEAHKCAGCGEFTVSKTIVQENGCCSQLDSKRVTLKDKRALGRVFPELKEKLAV